MGHNINILSLIKTERPYLLLVHPNSHTNMSCNISILTEDQRRRIEKNRLDALNKRKNAIMMAQQELNGLKIESAVKPVLKEEITNEQRARMEKNRQLALVRKRSRMQGQMNSSDTTASTQCVDAGIHIITPSTKRQKVKQDDAEKNVSTVTVHYPRMVHTLVMAD